MGDPFHFTYTREKGRRQERSGKNSIWNGESKLWFHTTFSTAQQKFFREYINKQPLSKCSITQMANLEGMHLKICFL